MVSLITSIASTTSLTDLEVLEIASSIMSNLSPRVLPSLSLALSSCSEKDC
ncbi:hypothetical protein [Clostridium tetani]|uniref:hypothetical protein n=1 Tax=Clostridium tetani TaxID=1513 RepID=UPI002955272F|nr:hypothetical protein [Clostridium tetani]